MPLGFEVWRFLSVVLNNVLCVCVCLILGHCELVLAADGFNEIWSCRINKHHLILLVFFPSVMCIKTIEVSPNVEECYWDFIEHERPYPELVFVSSTD